MYDYVQIEKSIKSQNFLFRDASLIDLSFHHLWALIGFYLRREQGDYYKKQSSIIINKKEINYENIVSDTIEAPKIPSAEQLDRKILILKSIRTNIVIEHLGSDRCFTTEDAHFSHPPMIKHTITHEEYEVIKLFSESTLNILKENNISLSSYDASFFKDLVYKLAIDYLHTYHQLFYNKEKINLIVMHADNHPPFIFWAIAAKILKIPTLMLQHGLDCEPYFLNEVYVDHVAVWGEERLSRYKQSHFMQPQSYCITGNPNYDSLKFTPLNTKFNSSSFTIGYIGRPHGIEKSYFDFRNPTLGQKIIKELSEIARKYPTITIILKTHPYDDLKQYTKIKLPRNITFSEESIDDVLQKVDIIFAEDSTSAIEALCYGKPVFILNYENTTPIVNLEKYKAGYVITSKNQLFETVANIYNQKLDLNHFKIDQKRVMEHYLNALDGKSIYRLEEYIEQILYHEKEKIQEIIFCTVITKNYLHFADSLHKTLVAENGNIQLKVLVVDGDKRLNDEYSFDIITLDEMNIPNLKHMLVYYNAFELVCSMKPFIIDFLFKTNHDKVVYLDADIFVTGSFYDLSCLLDTKDVLFTPHYNTTPPIDNLSPSESDMAYFGFINGGFWAMKKSKDSQEVLDWLKYQLTFYGFNKPTEGMFGDQLMISNAYFIFDKKISLLKDPRYNIGYWNMHDRSVKFRNGKFLVNDEPCVFFHLSRFREDLPKRFTIDTIHRVNVYSYPVTKDIIKEYIKYLTISSYKYIDAKYKYITFKNKELTPSFRYQYFNLVKDTLLPKEQPTLTYVTDVKFWEKDNGTKTRIISLSLYLKQFFNFKLIYLGHIKEAEHQILQELHLDLNTLGILDIPSIWDADTGELEEIYSPVKQFYNKNIANHFYTYVKTHHIDIAIFTFIRTVYLTKYLNENTITILDMIDILYKREEKLKTKGIQNWLKISKEQEYALYRLCDYQMAIQREEYNELLEAKFENPLYIPYALKTNKQIFHQKVRKIVYIAGKNEVNNEAIIWFLDNVWIYFHQLYNHINLHIYGTVCDILSNYQDQNLVLHGRIENFEEAYTNADLAINPIHVGGGLKIKSVEALANGLPLITTKEGASGMDEGINTAFTIANNKEEFLTFLIAIVEDNHLRKQMSDNAHDYALKNFGVKQSYQPLLDTIYSRLQEDQ